MSTEYLIVGAGAAGQSAAEAIRRRDPHGPITMVSEERHRFYSRPGLAYYLSGLIPEGQLHSRADADLRALRIHRLTARAGRLDPAAHMLLLSDGRSLRYDRLLLATGARAVRPDIPGIELDGVVTLDSLDDARNIVARARRARRAVVVGGGITALELAEGLAARGVETHYLLRRARYWASVLDAQEAELVEHQLAARRIRLHRNAELEAVSGRRGRVAAVRLSKGDTIECQILAVAIGIRPRTNLALAGGLEVERGILVSERMETSQPDVFAAGDVAEVLDPESGRRHLDSLWWASIEAGAVAGENLAGGSARHERPAPFNVTSLAGLPTTILGSVGDGAPAEDLVAIARGDSEVWRRTPQALALESGQAHNRLRLHLADRTILGAVLMGDQTLSRPLLDLIRRKVDISRVRPALVAQPAHAADLLLSFWAEWKGDDACPS